MKTKSIWGNPPKRLYKLIDVAQENLGNEIEACIVGCSDGKFLMPFARKKIKVTGYDIDDVALYGGIKEFPVVKERKTYEYSPNFISEKYNLEKRKVIGIIERLKLENISKYAKIEKRDFYKNPPKKKFDVVFTSCSLHYSVNKMFSLKEKTKHLQRIVKKNGYLYIDYMMAIDENDFETYPVEKFYRKREILNYFDDSWKIISIKENNFPTFEGAHVDCVRDHFHRFGYIFARRIK